MYTYITIATIVGGIWPLLCPLLEWNDRFFYKHVNVLSLRSAWESCWKCTSCSVEKRTLLTRLMSSLKRDTSWNCRLKTGHHRTDISFWWVQNNRDHINHTSKCWSIVHVSFVVLSEVQWQVVVLRSQTEADWTEVWSASADRRRRHGGSARFYLVYSSIFQINLLMSNAWFTPRCSTAKGNQQHERTTNVFSVGKTTLARTASKVRLRECASSALKVNSEADWQPQKCCPSLGENSQDKHISRWETRNMCSFWHFLNVYGFHFQQDGRGEERLDSGELFFITTLVLMLFGYNTPDDIVLIFCSLSHRRFRPPYRDMNRRWRPSVCSTARFGRRILLLRTPRLVFVLSLTVLLTKAQSKVI